MKPWLDDGDVRLYVGDALDVLRGMPDGSVDCCVTSPPYWGLRDYGTGAWDGGDPDCDHLHDNWSRGTDPKMGTQQNRDAKRTPMRDVCGKCGARRVDQQFGLEPTPDEYVTNMVAVFREVRRVLADHGTCWVNLGDSYIAGQGGRQSAVGEMPAAPLAKVNQPRDRDDVDTGAWGDRDVTAKMTPARGTTDLKPKDLAGIPWMVAFALRADGWYLRADVIWAKPNPMPESVTDRPTKAHEYVFLLSKRPRYWFDAEAVREPLSDVSLAQIAQFERGDVMDGRRAKPMDASRKDGGGPLAALGGGSRGSAMNPAGRNVRSVWEIATQPYAGAHFATYPQELVRRCVLAGCAVRVCRTCGKPSERIVEAKTSWAERKANGAEQGSGWSLGGPREGRSGDQNSVHGAGMSHDLTPKARVDHGWSDCGHNAWRRGVVLDPFAGSGTTGLVARSHGRHAILIELNEEYAALAATRLQQLSLLA